MLLDKAVWICLQVLLRARSVLRRLSLGICPSLDFSCSSSSHRLQRNINAARVRRPERDLGEWVLPGGDRASTVKPVKHRTESWIRERIVISDSGENRGPMSGIDRSGTPVANFHSHVLP